MTSSLDAITVGHPKSDDAERTEANWSHLEHADDYPKSKTLAEQAGWKTVDGTELELVTINPGLTLGPLERAQTNASLETVRMLLAHELPMVPNLGFAIADVRDVVTRPPFGDGDPGSGGAAVHHRWIAPLDGGDRRRGVTP